VFVVRVCARARVRARVCVYVCVHALFSKTHPITLSLSLSLTFFLPVCVFECLRACVGVLFKIQIWFKRWNLSRHCTSIALSKFNCVYCTGIKTYLNNNDTCSLQYLPKLMLMLMESSISASSSMVFSSRTCFSASSKQETQNIECRYAVP